MTGSRSAGSLLIDVGGLELEAADRDRLRHPAIGGVVLFTRNYRSPDQLRALATEIHALRRPPLLVTVDHEGGRVQRFRDGFTRLPAAAAHGALYDRDPARGLASTRAAGWLMASELLACGVDLSFAPVADVATCPNEVIGTRAFHRRPDAVAELCRAYLAGMRDAGMPATAKHFPGHGGVSADSHVELPRDDRSMSEVRGCDLVPYRRLIADGLDAVMTGHVLYPRVDDRPPTFSRRWLVECLRVELGFGGLVFSDDLGMGAALVAGDPRERVMLALEAGCDAVLLTQQADAVDDLLSAWRPGRGPRGAGLEDLRPRRPVAGQSRERALSSLDEARRLEGCE